MSPSTSTPIASVSDGIPGEQVVFSVSELAEVLQEAVAQLFPAPVWVTGEVANLSRSNAGHIYLDLTERPPEGSGGQPALLSAVIWESRKRAINEALVSAKWGRVSDGDELKVKVSVTLYPPQGRISLRIQEVDPRYTLSRWKRERERVVAMLQEEGIFESNRRLVAPAAPYRVGLITSQGSNAQADFLATLAESALGWQVSFHHSGVQGDGARGSLIEALGKLAALGPDVICIVRGGGSTTDLAVFDNVDVARAIARCPTPVITGIGHELDQTVSDLVAYRSEKTPTACAQWLVNHNRVYLRRVERAGRAVADIAGVLVTRHRRNLDGSPQALQVAADGAVMRCRLRLYRWAERLPTQVLPRLRRAEGRLLSRFALLDREARQAIDRRSTRLGTTREMVKAYDPRRNLARGWSITRRRGGGLISSVTGIEENQVIETLLADGTVVSKVRETVESVPDAAATDSRGECSNE